jgi:hypothetical protein
LRLDVPWQNSTSGKMSAPGIVRVPQAKALRLQRIFPPVSNTQTVGAVLQWGLDVVFRADQNG